MSRMKGVLLKTFNILLKLYRNGFYLDVEDLWEDYISLRSIKVPATICNFD